MNKKLIQIFSQLKAVRLLLFLLIQPHQTVARTPGADTLALELPAAEQLFLKNNLQMLAQKYNVEAARALILQAKLYPNPGFNFLQAAYNPETKKWFEQDFENGEQAVQVSQLVVLSRKIKKQTKMAETGYQLAEDNLEDLLRTLRLALRSSFYAVYYSRLTAEVYDQEITALIKMVAAFHEVKGKGYVSESDLVLIQAQLYTLQNEYQTLLDNINDQESQMRILLQLPPNQVVVPVSSPKLEEFNVQSVTFQALIDSAYQNRTDLKISKDNLTLSQQNLIYQKAMAVPDLTLQAGYDRHGSYVTNFNAISMGISIPIFNRNQGNIKNARWLVDFNQTQLKAAKKNLEEQVARGWQKAIDASRLYQGIDPAFASKFEELAAGMLQNYMKRNVSLLTFLNFYDSYKQNIVQLNTIRLNKVNALENLNYLTGANFFNK